MVYNGSVSILLLRGTAWLSVGRKCHTDILASLEYRFKLITDIRPAHQVLVSGIVLGKFLIHHIAIRLYGTQEIPQECLYRSLATAVILVIAIEEAGYLLRLVHKNPHVLLEVSAEFGLVTLKLDSDLCPCLVNVKNGLHL